MIYRYLPIVFAIVGFTIGCMMRQAMIEKPLPEPVVVQQPVSDPVPNLSVEELAEMSGFDASTDQTRREQVRNNDLAWRVEKLEREVRNLNQRVYGIAELRIGDQPPANPEGAE